MYLYDTLRIGTLAKFGFSLRADDDTCPCVRLSLPYNYRDTQRNRDETIIELAIFFLRREATLEFTRHLPLDV